jgi:phospholipid/cholesterol/gamma-HCH transport system permease protein
MQPPSMTAGEVARVRAGAVRPRLVPPALAAFVDALGEIALLSRDAVHVTVRRPPEWRHVVEQLDQIGWRSLSIVNLTALFTGMVLALQLGSYLERFGAKMFVSRIVGVSLLRELGPVLAALLFGGRVGAGITAELGSMAVTEQVDAVRALGASPVRNLVVPRLIATVVMLPALTVIADLVGVLGGLFMGVTELRVSADFYVNSLLQILQLNDVLSGLGKSVFFAYFIGIIACRNGLAVTGGADGVGRATTATVVAASITVLVSDFFLTKLFLLL